MFGHAPRIALLLHNILRYVTMVRLMRTLSFFVCFCLCMFVLDSASAEQGLTINGIRYFSYPGFTRIVFEAENAAPYVLTKSEDGRSLFFSSYGGSFILKVQQLPAINDGVVQQLEVRQENGPRAVIIILGTAAGDVKDFVLRGPDRIVVDISRGAPSGPGPEKASKSVVVLDPGHGGADIGIITSDGAEKNLSLELANSVQKILRRGGAGPAVFLTRERDRLLSFEERAAFANAAGPLVFVSLHISSAQESRVFQLDPDESGIVFENGPRSDFFRIDSLSSRMLPRWGSQQREYAHESGRLGKQIARALADRDNAEPYQAPIAVLKPVAAAAVLVEIGAGQSRIKAAEAVARGIEQYVNEKR